MHCRDADHGDVPGVFKRGRWKTAEKQVPDAPSAEAHGESDEKDANDIQIFFLPGPKRAEKPACARRDSAGLGYAFALDVFASLLASGPAAGAGVPKARP